MPCLRIAVAKYKDFFVDLMMTEELSLPVPGDSDNTESLKDGITCANMPPTKERRSLGAPKATPACAALACDKN